MSIDLCIILSSENYFIMHVKIDIKNSTFL